MRKGHIYGVQARRNTRVLSETTATLSRNYRTAPMRQNTQIINNRAGRRLTPRQLERRQARLLKQQEQEGFRYIAEVSLYDQAVIAWMALRNNYDHLEPDAANRIMRTLHHIGHRLFNDTERLKIINAAYRKAIYDLVDPNYEMAPFKEQYHRNPKSTP